MKNDWKLIFLPISLAIGLLFLKSITASGQQNIIKVPVEDAYYGTYPIGNNGILLVKEKTFYLGYIGYDYKLLYYTPEKGKVWETTIHKKQKVQNLGEHIIYSSSGNFIYLLEEIGYQHERKYLCTQIDIKGEQRTFEIKDLDKKGLLQYAYAGDSFLYLAYRDSNSPKNKEGFRNYDLTIHRYSNSDLSYEKITVDLPAMNDGEQHFFWYYCGHEEGAFYLAYREIYDQKLLFTIVKVSPSGKIIKTINFDATPQEGFIQPSSMDDYYNGVVENTGSSKINWTSFGEYTYRVAFSPAFGHIKIVDSMIYVYGLTASKPFGTGIGLEPVPLTKDAKKLETEPVRLKYAPTCTKFHLSKFSMSGEKIWTTTGIIPEEFTGNNKFTKWSDRKKINCLVEKDETIHFKLTYPGKTLHAKISSDGSITEQKINILAKNICMSSEEILRPVDGSKAMDYINSLSLGELEEVCFRYYVFKEDEILYVKSRNEEGVIKLLHFEK